MKVEDNTIMPDGRPLFAWNNELNMLRKENSVYRTSIDGVRIFQEFCGIIFDSWQEPQSLDWKFTVKATDAITAPDFKENLRKYINKE